MEESALDGLMMKEYFRGWTPNLRATFIGLGKNLLAAPEESITLTSFIAALRFYTMLRRDTWHPYYLPGDAHATLIQPLIDGIEARGGKIVYGTTALALECDEAGGWRVRVEDQARRGLRSVLTEQVILATNAPAAQRLLGSSSATAEAARELRFPDGLRTTTVRLWFDRSPGKGTVGGMFTGDFPFDNFFWLHKMQAEFRQWHDEAGGSAIELHLYGSDAQNDEADKVMLIRAVNELQRVFPELKGHYRTRRGAPQQQDAYSIPRANRRQPARRDALAEYLCLRRLDRLPLARAVDGARLHHRHRRRQRDHPHTRRRTCSRWLKRRKPEMVARGLQRLIYGGRRMFGKPIRSANRVLRRGK